MFSVTTEINFTCQCLVEDYCDIQDTAIPEADYSDDLNLGLQRQVGFSNSALLFPKYVISLIPTENLGCFAKLPPGVPKLGKSEIGMRKSQ